METTSIQYDSPHVPELQDTVTIDYKANDSIQINGLSISGICKNSSYNHSLSECNSLEPLGITSDVYSDIIAISDVFNICISFTLWLTVVVGLIGNGLVVIAIIGNRKMKSPTNMLIMNLAAADLLYIIFCMVFTAWDIHLPKYPFGDVWCRMSRYLTVVSGYASIYTLVLMSLVRFLAVVHPLKSIPILTKRNTYITIGLLWLILLIGCTPALYTHGEVLYGDLSSCTYTAIEEYEYASFQMCFFLTSFALPMGMIFFIYLLMLKHLWCGPVAPGDHVSDGPQRSKRRATRLVVVVVLVFAFCWCPFQVVSLLKSLNAYELNVTNYVVATTAYLLANVNSCVNPILYAFLSENFRKAFRNTIACKSKCGSKQELGDLQTAGGDATGSLATLSSNLAVSSVSSNII